MSYDAINRKLYEKPSTVLSFANSYLYVPEVMIFLKYRDNIVNKRVLDIGCGAGRTTLFLKNLTNQYTGIDYSKSMIDYCENQFKDLQFLQHDVRDMQDFVANGADFILFSYNGIDVIDHEDRLLALSEIHRVLDDKGLFVFSTHNRNYLNTIIKPSMYYTWNPLRQFKNLAKFVIGNYNRSSNSRYQVFCDQYAIIVDQPGNFGLLLYHINKGSQIAQLEDIGFEVIDLYDTNGNSLDLVDDDSNSAWIYYVARKRVANQLSV